MPPASLIRLPPCLKALVGTPLGQPPPVPYVPPPNLLTHISVKAFDW